MSTEDATSDPKEPEGTEVSTETTESDTADISAGAKTVGTADETETATVPAEDSPKADGEKSTTGEAEKAGGSTEPDTSAAGADEPSGAGEADRPAETKEAVAEAAVSGKGVGLGKPTAGKRSVLTRGRVLFVAAAVLLIAAMVAVGVLAFQSTDRRQELNRRAAATKAACDFGHNFATYTGDKVDDYLSRLDRSATGEWKKLVAEIGPDLKARFAERQVSSSASDVQCGYESGSDNKARVVLIIDQSFTTADSATPGQVKVAANVDMEQVGNRWMVADFDTPMVRR